MENDLRLKITDYFSYKPEDRDKIIQELTEFYFERNVSTRTQHEFETSIDQLLFSLQLEYQFALKSENYNRVEIYQKLSRIFWNIKEQFLEANGL